jgi:hypothetical protein
VKISIDKGELKNHLKEQLELLEASAIRYDEGQKAEAKRISVSLRTMLHDTNRSTSLFKQLGILEDLKVRDSADDYSAVRIGYTELLMVHQTDLDVDWAPAFLANPQITKLTRFEDWWKRVVLIDSKAQVFTRKSIVVDMANQDGGAHVDGKLMLDYYNLTRENSMGFEKFVFTGKTIDDPNGKITEIGPFGGPERPLIRQVAHELLLTLKPDYVRKLKPMPNGIFFGMPRFINTKEKE